MSDSANDSRIAELEKRVRSFRRMVRCIGELIPADELRFVRASGDALCPVCGLKLYDHPTAAGSTLVVSCQGQQYHL